MKKRICPICGRRVYGLCVTEEAKSMIRDVGNGDNVDCEEKESILFTFLILTFLIFTFIIIGFLFLGGL
jgi:nitrate reductase NapE component